MAKRVVLYRLTAKLVDTTESVPEDAKSVMYYALSVGHHTGVMDCFEEVASCSVEMYEGLVERYPAGLAHDKMQGVLKFGEIQIDKSHVPSLYMATNVVLRSFFFDTAVDHSEEIDWMQRFARLLEQVEREDALYLMCRKVDE